MKCTDPIVLDSKYMLPVALQLSSTCSSTLDAHLLMKRLLAIQAEIRVVTRSERKDNKPVSFSVMCLR